MTGSKMPNWLDLLLFWVAIAIAVIWLGAWFYSEFRCPDDGDCGATDQQREVWEWDGRGPVREK